MTYSPSNSVRWRIEQQAYQDSLKSPEPDPETLRRERLAANARAHIEQAQQRAAHERRLERGRLFVAQCLVHASRAEREECIRRVAVDPRWTDDQRCGIEPEQLGTAFTETLAEIREEDDTRDSSGRFKVRR
jgi:hypothetical protein